MLWFYLFYVLKSNLNVVGTLCMFSYFIQLSFGYREAVNWEIAAQSAYDIFSHYMYLIVNLVFSLLGFWSENFFLIAPFPDHCLLVPFLI